MGARFNPAPGWPTPPPGWLPPVGWAPDPSWPPAPPGWRLIVTDDDAPTTAVMPHARPGDVWAVLGRPLAGVGAVKVRMDPVHLFVERGFLSTDSQQIPLAWVSDVDGAQSPAQKLRGVGTVRVHVMRHGLHEVMTLDDLPDFRHGVQMINEYAGRARGAALRAQHTQHLTYQSSPPGAGLPASGPMAASAGSPAGQEDVLAILERLDRLRQSGGLTDEEFQRKKAELLGRL